MTVQRGTTVHLCSGMLQKSRFEMVFQGRGTIFFMAGILLAAAGTAAGCLPASRVSSRDGNSTEAKAAAELLAKAGAETTLGVVQKRLMVASQEWLGTPYTYGGTSSSGVDCSGFVLSVYSKVGLNLPRTSRDQAETGRAVRLTEVEAGDLLFFNTTGTGVSHVGISIGGYRFIHASSSRGVIVSSLEESYYRERFLFARRHI
jgi:cell wall-associated NlpC family hydrolase